MRIQRYLAKDMRSALAQVRESLGSDAVILSSGKIGDEVEVVAAIDAEVAQAVASAPPARYEPPRVAMPRAEPAPAARRASSQLSESIAPAPSIERVSAAHMPPPPPIPVPSAGQDALA